jgi:hypothetical protein
VRLMYKSFYYFLALGLFFFIPTNLMAATVEPCPNETNTRWHACFGYYTYDDNSEYAGEWENNVPNGQGTYKKPNGFVYVGEFSNGNFNGLGTATWPDGSRYIGSWKDGKFNGNGSLFSPTGETKTGLWSEGKFQEQKNAVKPLEPHNSEIDNKDHSSEINVDTEITNPSFITASEVKTDKPQQAIRKALNIIREHGTTIDFQNPIYLDGSPDREIVAKTKNVKFFETLFNTMEVDFVKDRETWEYKIIFPDEIQVVGNETAEITSSSIDEISVNGIFLEEGLKPIKLEILARELDIQAKEGFLAFKKLEVEQEFDHRVSRQSYFHSANLEDFSFESPEVEIFIEDFSLQSEMNFENTDISLNMENWPPFIPNFDYTAYFSLVSMASQLDEELSLKNVNIVTSEGDIQFERLLISGRSVPQRNKINRIDMSGKIEKFILAGFEDIPETALPYIPNLLRFDITAQAKNIDYSGELTFEDIFIDSGPLQDLISIKIAKFLVSSEKFSIDIKGNLKPEPSSSTGIIGNLEINIDGLNGVISEFQSNPSPEMMPALPILLMLRGLSNSDPQENSRNSSDSYTIEINSNSIMVNGTDLSDLIPQ